MEGPDRSQIEFVLMALTPCGKSMMPRWPACERLSPRSSTMKMDAKGECDLRGEKLNIVPETRMVSAGGGLVQ